MVPFWNSWKEKKKKEKEKADQQNEQLKNRIISGPPAFEDIESIIGKLFEKRGSIDDKAKGKLPEQESKDSAHTEKNRNHR